MTASHPDFLVRARAVEGWMSETQLAFLYTTALAVPERGTVVEVGSWRGRSTIALCEGLTRTDGVSLSAIDTFRGGDPEAYDSQQWELEGWTSDDPGDEVYQDFRRNIAPYEFVEVIRDESVRASKKFDEGSVDLIFLDGDHSYDGVCADITAWFPKLAPTGILAGHDYGFFGVTHAVHSLLSGVNVWDAIWFVRRDEAELGHHRVYRASLAARRMLEQTGTGRTFVEFAHGHPRAWRFLRSLVRR